MDPAVKSNNDPLHKGTPNEGCHRAGISQSLGGTRSIGLSRRLTRPINAKSEKGEYEHNGKPKSQLMLLLFPLSLSFCFIVAGRKTYRGAQCGHIG